MLALPLVSCQTTIEDTGDTAVAAPEIFAEVETQPATKTQLVVDGGGEGTIYWKPGDEINVFYGTTSTHYISQNTSNATTAVFRTTDVIGSNEGEWTLIWGLYPYDANAVCDGNSVTTTLPNTQYGVPGTFDDDLFITLARSGSTDLNFYNLCGGIKFSLSRDDITSITFKGNNNESLAGKVSASLYQGLPKATVVSGKKEVTLYPRTGSTFAKNKYYYFILLPQTLSKGFTMTFTTSGGKSGTFNYQTDPNDVLKVVTIKRSIFKTQSNIDLLSNLPSPSTPPVGNNYSKVLFLGNSITKHGINEYWWGLWGMAATTRENDYVHRVMAGIRSHNQSTTFSAVNIANWEQDFSTPLSSLISLSDLSADTDLIVIRLGENVSNTSGFQNALTNLYNYVTGIAPNARVIITGQFWPNSEKEAACKNVATAKGATYVKINQYGNSAYEERVGNYVYGDDGQWHMIDRSDVASHPSDAGMQAIANEILAVLY